MDLTTKMKYIKHFFTAALLVAVLPLAAQSIDRATALEKAQALMNEKGITFHKERVLHRAAAHDVEPYYIFNGDRQQGFVIIGGVEGAPVLGYSTTGNLDVNKMAPALQNLLAAYSRRAAGEQLEDVTVVSRAATPTRLCDDIACVETARWFQDTPFNDQCPKVTVYTDAQCQNVFDVFGKLQQDVISLTGCVATALAIVFYQNKYPTQTIAAIEDRTNAMKVADAIDPVTKQLIMTYTVFNDQGFPAGTVLEYDKMKLDYVKHDDQGKVVLVDELPVIDATDEQKAAVAKLMHVCGSSSKMLYSIGETGGSAGPNDDMIRGLWKYFGMTGATIHRQDEYTLEEWRQLLYDELLAGRVVHYGGSSRVGGHAFVCDGYQFKDNTHLFHINWGWGPHINNDGYYSMELLAPVNQSKPEKGPDEPGFTYGQNIVRGLYPGAQAQPHELFCSHFSLDNSKTIKMEDGKISLPITLKVGNTSYAQFSSYLAAVVVDEQNEKHVIPFSDTPMNFPFTQELEIKSDANKYISFDYEPSYGKNFTMYLAARENASEEWKECRGNSWCAFVVKDDNSVEHFEVTPFSLDLLSSGVNGNTVDVSANKQIRFTSRIKISRGSLHEMMYGQLIPIVAEGVTQPNEVWTNNPFMVYGDEGDVLDIRFTFNAADLKPGKYQVQLMGDTTKQTAELFTLTVTDATDIRPIADGQRPAADAPAYDLQGRQLSSKPAKGLYITQGRKYMK